MLENSNKSGVLDWLKSAEGWVDQGRDEGHSFSLKEYLDLLIDIAKEDFQEGKPLGLKLNDLARVLAELSLGGPGTCALQSLHRIAPDIKMDNSNTLSATIRVAYGFRFFFNLPQSLLQAQSYEMLQDSKFWRESLHYGIDRNIQSIMDEQVHVLLENQGLSNSDIVKYVEGISKRLANSRSIRTAQIKIVEECRKFNSEPTIEYTLPVRTENHRNQG